jgi:hypothetical protein
MYPRKVAGVALWLLLSGTPLVASSQPGAETEAPPPDFQVLPRQDKLRYFPCAQCHKFLPANNEERALYAPHNKDLPHGGKRFWCLTCHDPEDRNQLRTMNGKTVGFNESYEVCAQCHAQRAEDWRYGGHGKRVGTWNGERTIYSCVECHDPHDPPIKPIAPDAPPPPRIGFPPPEDHGHPPQRLWEVLLDSEHP